jgi:hypothetical protein
MHRVTIEGNGSTILLVAVQHQHQQASTSSAKQAITSLLLSL